LYFSKGRRKLTRFHSAKASQSNIVCCGAQGNSAHASGVSFRSSETEETMQDRLKSGIAPETLSLFALIVAMAMFGAGILYAGDSLREPQKTAQLVLPDLNP
jgi:hypothetical protein